MMTAAELFFYAHAGWSYDPKTETSDQGRERCARELAQAEAWAERRGIGFVWEDDWSVDHVTEFPDAYDQEPSTCESCVAYDSSGMGVASLGCIDDATAEYRRVIEAELASEAKDEAYNAEPVIC